MDSGSRRQERRKIAASNYKNGKSRHPYSLNTDIRKGTELTTPPNEVCDDCKSLSDLKEILMGTNTRVQHYVREGHSTLDLSMLIKVTEILKVKIIFYF